MCPSKSRSIPALALALGLSLAPGVAPAAERVVLMEVFTNTS